jgi:hypothetical protein
MTPILFWLLTFSAIYLVKQSHGPKMQEDTLQVPLLKHKKSGGSKAPAVILGELSSMF